MKEMVFIKKSKNKKKKLNFTNLSWEELRLNIEFIKDGYASEAYGIIKCLMNQDEMIIKSIFLVGEDLEKSIWKERLELEKIKKMWYTEFIIWLTDLNSRGVVTESGETEIKKIKGLEIRFQETSNEYLIFPIKESIKKILKNVVTNAI